MATSEENVVDHPRRIPPALPIIRDLHNRLDAVVSPSLSEGERIRHARVRKSHVMKSNEGHRWQTCRIIAAGADVVMTAGAARWVRRRHQDSAGPPRCDRSPRRRARRTAPV